MFRSLSIYHKYINQSGVSQVLHHETLLPIVAVVVALFQSNLFLFEIRELSNKQWCGQHHKGGLSSRCDLDEGEHRDNVVQPHSNKPFRPHLHNKSYFLQIAAHVALLSGQGPKFFFFNAKVGSPRLRDGAIVNGEHIPISLLNFGPFMEACRIGRYDSSGAAS
tara:strand:- start:100 stop:591 length:492 start_codon:yes stop_codon:yes gene_type:complete